MLYIYFLRFPLKCLYVRYINGNKEKNIITGIGKGFIDISPFSKLISYTTITLILSLNKLL